MGVFKKFMEVVLATKNKGKIKEIRNLLRDMDITVQTLLDFPSIPEIDEKGRDYKENARIKAEMVASFTGKIALSDDSGLEVYALNGKPGKDSARFISKNTEDDERNRALLKLLEDVPLKERGARFCCVVAIVKPKGDIYFCEGYCEGLISEDLRGKRGFGYDPIFMVPKYNQTFAEMDTSLKNKISHRGIALKKAKEILVLLKER